LGAVRVGDGTLKVHDAELGGGAEVGGPCGAGLTITDGDGAADVETTDAAGDGEDDVRVAAGRIGRAVAGTVTRVFEAEHDAPGAHEVRKTELVDLDVRAGRAVVGEAATRIEQRVGPAE